jgi:hypothetical protein
MELVADCPRCASKKITFEATNAVQTDTEYSWKRWWEVFAICRHCVRPTIFVVSQRAIETDKVIEHKGILNLPGVLNHYVDVESYVSIKDIASTPPPDHLPPEVEAAFREGSACLAIGCYNAAAAMFRLSLDLATGPLLPKDDVSGLSSKTR